MGNHDDFRPGSGTSHECGGDESIDPRKSRFDNGNTWHLLLGYPEALMRRASFTHNRVACLQKCRAETLTVDGLMVNEKNSVVFVHFRHSRRPFSFARSTGGYSAFVGDASSIHERNDAWLYLVPTPVVPSVTPFRCWWYVDLDLPSWKRNGLSQS